MSRSSRLPMRLTPLLKCLALSCVCLGFTGCDDGVSPGSVSVPKRDGMAPGGGNDDAKTKASGKQTLDNKVMMPGGKKM